LTNTLVLLPLEMGVEVWCGGKSEIFGFVRVGSTVVVLCVCVLGTRNSVSDWREEWPKKSSGG
jgi:hypothetical protein